VDQGDNGILFSAKAYRLKRGTAGCFHRMSWHAPGSSDLEPQWGLRRLRHVINRWSNVARSLDLLVQQGLPEEFPTTWIISSSNAIGTRTLIRIKTHNYLEPIVRIGRWSTRDYVRSVIVYCRVEGNNSSVACELTVEPCHSATSGPLGLRDDRRPGGGKIGTLPVDSPNSSVSARSRRTESSSLPSPGDRSKA